MRRDTPMKPTRGDYDIMDTENFGSLLERLKEINKADSSERIELVADTLLNGHNGVTGYLTFGNYKLAKNVGILNINSATDCPNAGSSEDNPSETGVCQVPFETCYAHVSEKKYPNTLKKRRLQEYFWDNVDAVTLSDALRRVKERMRSSFDYLRVSQSGDIRHRGDILKLNEIARRLSGDIEVYTYSASHKLDWSDSEHFTVNQSNNLANYGDRNYVAVDSPDAVPEDSILCPYDAAKHNGIDAENRPKCGECTKCIEPESEQERNVYITIH